MTSTPDDQAPEPVDLLVCIKCRRGQEIPTDERRPGQLLFDALAEKELPQGVRLHPVECMQNCDAGCTIALRGAGRWTYIYGNFRETSHPDLILEGAVQYQATADGVIPWRERSEHFKRNCVARVPAEIASIADTQTGPEIKND